MSVVEMPTKKTGYFQTGTVLNEKWVILQFIGRGAMGEVHRAHQSNLNRDVAIKIILPELLRELDGSLINATVIRFRREVQAMAQVRHSNVLHIYDYGMHLRDQTGKEYEIDYFVMEYVPGTTFRYVMSEEGYYRSRDNEERIRSWIKGPFLKVLDGVQALHENGVIHRDLKPENILMENDTPKIADLGLVRWDRSEPVTDSIEFYGTLTYMPPEQLMNYKHVDHRADIYALGKILYEAIRGKLGEKTVPLRQAWLENPDTPFLKEIDAVIRKATAENKEDRYDSVNEFRGALENLLAGKVWLFKESGLEMPLLQNPRLIRAGILIAVMAVAGMSVWHLADNPLFRKWNEEPVTKREAREVGEDNRASTKPSANVSVGSLPPTIMGEDGLTMKLVAGGKFRTSAGNFSRAAPVSLFYLDESFVTNHNYTEFLNDIRDYLSVKNGIVTEKSKILLYTEDHPRANAQIIYEHGRFHLKDVRLAAAPVVSVPWHGAMAYARHYRKRLPTENEWRYAARIGSTPVRNLDEIGSKSTGTPSDAMMDGGMMHGMHSIAAKNKAPNRRIDKSGSEEYSVTKIWVGEKSSSEQNFIKEEAINPGMSYMAITGSSDSANELITTDPEEAFPDVGFNCVRNAVN